jgi:2-(1,2-epoxy-1,2-dihydrophenyl)acetyl-CoA isomerase
VSAAKVLLEVRNGAATVTLNSARNGNAIDLDLAKDLANVLQRCEQDSDVRAILICGEGRMFCAGGDLAAIQDQNTEAPAYVRSLLEHLHDAILSIARIPVPVVVAVQGAAAGAGLALVCACDLAIATQSCRFLMAYARVGLTPDGSSSWFLPRLIGERRALELALLNRELTAEEALRWGLVNDVVPDDRLQDESARLMEQLATGATAAFGDAKRLLRTSLQNDLPSQLTHEMETLCRALERREADIGMSAFRAKTAPKFRS